MTRKIIEITDDRRKIANALRALRQAAGLSQADVAKRSGLSQPKVSALEAGRGVGIRSIQRAMKGMGGSVSIVFDVPLQRAVSDGISADRPLLRAPSRKRKLR